MSPGEVEALLQRAEAILDAEEAAVAAQQPCRSWWDGPPWLLAELISWIDDTRVQLQALLAKAAEP